MPGPSLRPNLTSVKSDNGDNSRLSFSDSLSPAELTAWLTQELESKGLTLDESQRRLLLGKVTITNTPNGCYSEISYSNGQMKISMAKHSRSSLMMN